MKSSSYIIDIQAGRTPYNTYMVLPLPLLRLLTPVLGNALLQGLLGTEGADRVVLHLTLDSSQILEVNRLVARMETPQTKPEETK